MPEEEDAVDRRRLTEVLTRHGFGWVVAEAEAQIAEGKPVAKQVSEPEFFSPADDPLFRVRTPRRRRASLITSEPYSEVERLEILLKGIEAALVQRADIELAVLKELEGVNAIEFEPEAPLELAGGYLGTRHRLDRDRIESARDLKRRAQEALAGMRGRLRDFT